jgi:hypothetical protein
MATFTVRDKQSGKTITFDWKGSGTPTQADIQKVFASARDVESTTQPSEQVISGQPPRGVQIGQPRPPVSLATLGAGPAGLGPAFAQEDVMETLRNIIPSGRQVGTDILTALKDPVGTGKALGRVALGGIEKIQPGDVKQFEAEFDTFSGFLKDRYGSIENFGRTLKEDPSGVALDVSSALSGIGGGVRLGTGVGAKAGIISKTGKIAQVGERIRKAGQFLDPIDFAVRTAKPVVKGIGLAVEETLGATTGAGRASVREAMRSSKEFRQAMRGGIPPEDIVQSARSGLQTIKEQRANRYMGQLEEISKVKQSLDIKPLRDSLDSNLKRFKVKRTEKGGLDFSRSVWRGDSTQAKAFRKEIADIVNMIDEQGIRPLDLSPPNIDILKRAIEGHFSDNKDSKAFVSSLANKTRDILKKNVDGYDDMVRDYEKSSRLINEMDMGLSLKGGRTPEQVLKKLTQGLKESADFKRDFIRILEGTGEQDLMAKIAGLNLNKVLPEGSITRLLGAGELAFLFRADARLLPIILANSPRGVGEFFAAISKPSKAIKKTAPFIKPTTQTAFQAGRQKRLLEEQGFTGTAPQGEPDLTNLIRSLGG